MYSTTLNPTEAISTATFSLSMSSFLYGCKHQDKEEKSISRMPTRPLMKVNEIYLLGDLAKT
jgi:hypothetical protein